MKKISIFLVIVVLAGIVGCAAGPRRPTVKDNAEKAFDKLEVEQNKKAK